MAEDTGGRQSSEDGQGQSNPPSDAGPQGNPNKRRRRRWPYITGLIVLCIIVGLGILAALLPTLVSSDRGSRYLLTMVNDQIRGKVMVRGIDLSWRGPSTIDGVTVFDPQRRQVLSVGQVRVRNGLWQLLRRPTTFGEVDIDQPQVVMHMEEDKPSSLAQAFEPRQPAGAKPAPVKPETVKLETAGPPPQPRGQLLIHGGAVRVVKPDGQELGVTQIDGRLAVDTLDDIQAKLGAQLASGGQLQVDASLKGLTSGGKVDANQATGQFAVQTDQPVMLDTLLAFFDQPGVHGRATFSAQGHLDHGAVQADLKTQLNDFHTQPVKGDRQTQPEPIDLALTGQFTRSTQQAMKGRLDLTGGAGTASATFAFEPSSHSAENEAAGTAGLQPAELTGQDLVALLMTGKPVELPNLQASAEMSLNVHALAGAIPQLMRIQQGVEISKGEVGVRNLQVRTQPTLSAGGTFAIKDLSATRNGKPVDIQPIALNFNAHVELNHGLQIERWQFQSGFAEGNVQGNPSHLQGKFDADLAKLDQQLRQLVDLGDMQIGGTLSGQFTAARADGNKIDVTSSFRGTDLKYVSGENHLDVRQATLSPDASVLLRDQNVQRVVLNSLEANIDQQIQAKATGWYDVGDQTWKTDVNLQAPQLPYLVKQAQAMGVHALDQYAGDTGTADLQITASQDKRGGAIVSNGHGTLQGLQAGGEPVADNVKLQWQDATYSPDTKTATLQTASVKADFASFNAQNVKFQSGENMTLDGHVEATANVARTLAAAYRLTGKKDVPAVGGDLQLASDMQTKGKIVGLTGQATVSNFEVGKGKEAFRQEQVQLAYNAQMDNGNETIHLQEARLVSAPLTASVAGTIQQFRGKQVLDLRGDYQAKWDQVMAIVHQFAPDTEKTVDLKGESSSKFTVAGPAWQEGIEPPYRGVTAEGLDVSWQSGDVYGIVLGKAVLSPRLSDGKLDLPNASFPASGGTMSIGATVDLTRKEPQLRIPGRLQVMQDVDLNGEMGKQLLSFINPLFSQVAGMTGKVSMRLQDIDVPLGEAIKHSGTGQGHMDLANLRVEPGGGAFGMLAKISGQGGQGGQQALDIKVGNPDFRIDNGRIKYDNFTMTFPNGFDVVFHGSVGFDNTVDLLMGVPITAELLQQLGVRGPAAQYAGVLKGQRIDVPISGMRGEPSLDFSKVNVQPLVQQAIKNLAIQGLQQGIKGAVPGGALMPQPGGQQGQGGAGGLVPKLPAPGQPGQQQPQPPPQQQQKPPQGQPQGQPQGGQQQQQQTPGQQIGKGLQGIMGGQKKQ